MKSLDFMVTSRGNVAVHAVAGMHPLYSWDFGKSSGTRTGGCRGAYIYAHLPDTWSTIGYPPPALAFQIYNLISINRHCSPRREMLYPREGSRPSTARSTPSSTSSTIL